MKKHRRAKDTLSEIDHRPRKDRGQNFIINPAVVNSIIEFAKPNNIENILEIGPGLGALTEHLSEFESLTLVEIESKFCEGLRVKYPKAQIINQDFRKFDLKSSDRKWTIFGNLPYSYSTDILFHIIDSYTYVDRAVIMVQKEFAQRMAAPPGGRTFGALSVGCQLYADIKLGPIIEGDSFHPPANVQSQVVELKMLLSSRHEVKDRDFFRKVISASFQQRRKKLHNSLKGSGFFSAEKVDIALEKSGIDPSRRAETLNIEEFCRLTLNLEK